MAMVRRALLATMMTLLAVSTGRAQETLASSLESRLETATPRWSSFGRSLAIDTDTIVVGDPEAPGARTSVVGEGSLGGSVRVFTRTSEGWLQSAQIWTPRSDALFGSAVAISDGADRLVIGAPGYWGDGFVEIYVREGDTWILETTLEVEGDYTQLGASVAISAEGDRVVVGAPVFGDGGAGFVFVRTEGGWTREAMFGPLGRDFRGGAELGRSVALSDDGRVALLGAPNQSVDDALVGAGHVYVRTTSGWTEDATLTSTERAGGLGGFLGSEVALDAAGTRAFLCAPREAPTSLARVHVFERAEDAWSERAALPDVSFDINCGFAVDARGDRLVLASANGTDGTDDDVAFVRVFSRGVTSWREEAPLETAASEPWWRATRAAMDQRGEQVLAGVPTGMFGDPGDVYLHRLARAGAECVSDDDCVVGRCVDGLCCNQPCDRPCETCSATAGAIEDGRCSPIVGDDPIACDDGDPCTNDRCESILGCTFVPRCDAGFDAGTSALDATNGRLDAGLVDASRLDGDREEIDAALADAGERSHATYGCGCRAAIPSARPSAVALTALLAALLTRQAARRGHRRSVRR